MNTINYTLILFSPIYFVFEDVIEDYESKDHKFKIHKEIHYGPSGQSVFSSRQQIFSGCQNKSDSDLVGTSANDYQFRQSDADQFPNFTNFSNW